MHSDVLQLLNTSDTHGWHTQQQFRSDRPQTQHAPSLTLTQGRMWVMMMVSLLSSGKFSQNSENVVLSINKGIAYRHNVVKYNRLTVCTKVGERHSPLTLLAAAARTSASQSFSRFWKAGTRSFLVISGPTAFWSCGTRENAVCHYHFCNISIKGPMRLNEHSRQRATVMKNSYERYRKIMAKQVKYIRHRWRGPMHFTMSCHLKRLWNLVQVIYRI